MEPLCPLDLSILPRNKTPKRFSPNTQTRTPTREKQNEKTDKHLKPKLSPVERLTKKLPKIEEYFIVHKKIGEGTFSNVFVATCKLLRDGQMFAIKHLTPTSHPSRILQEMNCLLDIGGRDNVVGLEFCLRQKDAVAFVMPYFPHDSFSNYVTEMDPYELQLYMKNLLIALQRVHSFNVIHRDVKPSNFLYNRQEKRFLLVDFGLAHKVNHSSNMNCPKINRKRAIDEVDKDVIMSEPKRPVLHSLSSNVVDHSDRAKLSLKKKSPPFKENSPVAKNTTINRNINQVKRNLQFGNITTETKNDIGPFLGQKLTNETKGFNFNAPGSSFYRVQNSQIKSQVVFGSVEQASFRKPVSKSRFNQNERCSCDKKPRICTSCLLRKPMQAPRAGTPGYRSPEVLLKYPYQTTAVDVWSAGVIMLSIMSASYPFFRGPDDITALMELITVFGTNELRTTATKLGRLLLTSEQRKPLKLNKLCELLRRRSAGKKRNSNATNAYETSKQDRFENETPEEDDKQIVEKNSATLRTCHSCFQKIFPNEGCLCTDFKVDGNTSEEFRSCMSAEPDVFPKEAYDLLAKLLAIDPEKRVTAEAALRHPFFQMDLSR